VTTYIYITDVHLNLLRGLKISFILNPLVSQLIDSINLLLIIIHLIKGIVNLIIIVNNKYNKD
jgi:hypothetical protein